MKTSETLATILPALLAAQKELGGVKKESSNPFFKSTYADFNAVLAAIKPIYTSHGLVIIQSPVSEGNMVGVTTRICHESGEWIEGAVTLPLTKQDPQAAGSAITYAKRYALQSMALLPSVDDDAEQSMFRGPEPVETITNEQARELEKAIEVSGVPTAKICEAYKINKLFDLPANALDNAMSRLKATAQGNEQ